MQRLVTKLFLKKRFIFCSSGIEFDNKSDCENKFDLFIARKFDAIPDLHLKYIQNNCLGKLELRKVEQRLCSGDFILFYFWNSENESISGSYWALISFVESKWFDSFNLKKDEALLCNAFVDSKFRGMGLYKFLISKTHSYLKETFKVKKIYTIVEQYNYPSLSANHDFHGQEVMYIQFLIKIMGINFLSYLKNKEITILHLLKFHKVKLLSFSNRF